VAPHHADAMGLVAVQQVVGEDDDVNLTDEDKGLVTVQTKVGASNGQIFRGNPLLDVRVQVGQQLTDALKILVVFHELFFSFSASSAVLRVNRFVVLSLIRLLQIAYLSLWAVLHCKGRFNPGDFLKCCLSLCFVDKSTMDRR